MLRMRPHHGNRPVSAGEPIVLASASPRRADLLKKFRIPFDTIPASSPEPPPQPGDLPADHARHSAAWKARHVADTPGGRNRIILGADTIVTIDGMILGKPDSPGHARRILTQLSGNTHTVITGVALIIPGPQILTSAVQTAVTFRNLDAAEIDWYISTGEGRDKAGGYAIQGLGGAFISSISGCWFNVVGLPVPHIIGILQKHLPGRWPPIS